MVVVVVELVEEVELVEVVVLVVVVEVVVVNGAQAGMATASHSIIPDVTMPGICTTDTKPSENNHCQ